MKINLKKIKAAGFYLVAAAIILVEVIIGLVFIPSRLELLYTNSQKITSESTEITSMENVVKSIQNVDKNQLDIYTQKTNAAIPMDKKTTGIISGISSLASNYGVAVKNIEFSPGVISTTSVQVSQTASISGVLYIPAQLTVSSDLNSLIKFLTALRSVSQIIGVSDVAYSAAAGSGVTTTTQLLIYYLPASYNPVSLSGVKPLTTGEMKILDTLPQKDIFTLGPATH